MCTRQREQKPGMLEELESEERKWGPAGSAGWIEMCEKPRKKGRERRHPRNSKETRSEEDSERGQAMGERSVGPAEPRGRLACGVEGQRDG